VARKPEAYADRCPWYTAAVTFRHSLRIRYAECDMQGIVFNAHYLAYCDDAFGAWVEQALPGTMDFVGNDGTFDVMVKKASVTWHGALRFGETVDIDCSVARWGRSSFDVDFRGSVAGNDRFDIVVTYVNVAPGSHVPAAVSPAVKSALGD
jgi:acyl-CoA thioester hydrolase